MPMLTQKMSKEVMLIVLGVDKDDNLVNLDSTAALFDKTLTGLRDGNAELKLPTTSDPAIIVQLDKIISMWKVFNRTVQEIVSTGKVSKNQMATIIDDNPALLAEMNRCVKMYELDASKAGLKADPGLAVTINLSGRQRMLSQKMSKEFFIIVAGYNVKENRQNLLETSSLFDRTLKGLIAGNRTMNLPAVKSPEIRQQLEKIASIWRNFKPAIIFAISDRTKEIYPAQINTVARKNIPLLTEMNRAVGMYEREAAK